MAKLSTFIIGLLLSSFIMAVFALYMSEFSSNYGMDYNNSNISSLNKLKSLNYDINETRYTTDAANEKQGITDILGSYFSRGYQALRIASGSIDVYNEMTEQAFYQTSGLGSIGSLLKTTIIAIVVVIIFIGIIISALLKWYT